MFDPTAGFEKSTALHQKSYVTRPTPPILTVVALAIVDACPGLTPPMLTTFVDMDSHISEAGVVPVTVVLLPDTRPAPL